MLIVCNSTNGSSASANSLQSSFVKGFFGHFGTGWKSSSHWSFGTSSMVRKYWCLYKALHVVCTAIRAISTDKPHAVDTWAQFDLIDLVHLRWSRIFLDLNYNVFSLDRSITCWYSHTGQARAIYTSILNFRQQSYCYQCGWIVLLC